MHQLKKKWYLAVVVILEFIRTRVTLLPRIHKRVEQRAEISIPAPVRHPGQPLHAVVFALALRDDGKMWSGKVTFTASKPIEVEVLHPYEPKGEVDTMHGEPYHALLP
jgi:hypothetical protein